MIKVKQVAHVCIYANDIDETKKFYKDVLGLEPIFHFLRDGRKFGFYLEAGGRTHIEVFENDKAEYTAKNQITHLCLEVEDIDAASAHIAANGAEVTPKQNGCDDTWQIWTKDPNGIKIELFEYTDKSAQFTGGDRVAHW